MLDNVFAHAIFSLRLRAALPLLLGIGLICVPAAQADFSVRMPTVVKGEREVEAAYSAIRDAKREMDGQVTYNVAAGYGVTGFWTTEIEGEWEKPRGENTKLSEIAWENTFQLTEPGQYWVNLGFFAEYAWPQHSGDPQDVKLGPIAQLQFSRSLHTLNLFFEKQVGRNAGNEVELSYAWQSRFRIAGIFDAGIEIFGAPGEAGKPLPQDQQEIRVGPVLYGEWKSSAYTKLFYQAGYLIGATKAAPDGTWKASVEFEF
jgi:hypothetical protein